MKNRTLAVAVAAILALGVAMFGCTGGSPDYSTQHRQLIDKYVAAYNSHDDDEVARLYDANVMILYSDSPTPRFGRNEVVEGLKSFFRAFPDVQMDYTFFMSDSTFFAIEGTWRGTHTGPLQSNAGDIPPTGRKIEMPFVMIAEVSPEGLIVSDHGYYNLQAFIQQLFPGGQPLIVPDSVDLGN